MLLKLPNLVFQVGLSIASAVVSWSRWSKESLRLEFLCVSVKCHVVAASEACLWSRLLKPGLRA